MGKGSHVGCVRLGFLGGALLFLGGPTVFIVGMIILLAPGGGGDSSSHHDRASVAKHFNDALSAYNSHDAVQFRDYMNFTADGNSLQLLSSSVVANSDSVGMDPATSYYFMGRVGGEPLSVESYVNFRWLNTTTGESGSFVYSAPTVLPNQRASIACTRAVCATRSAKCGGPEFHCSAIAQRDNCLAHFGGTYHGGACKGGQSCGTCIHTARLSSICVVVRKSTTHSGYELDPAFPNGCTYPFKQQTYVPGEIPTTYEVKIRSNEDPQVQLSLLSHGSGNLDGHDITDVNHTEGIVILSVGSVLLAVVLISCVCCCCNEHHRNRFHAYRYVAFGYPNERNPYRTYLIVDPEAGVTQPLASNAHPQPVSHYSVNVAKPSRYGSPTENSR